MTTRRPPTTASTSSASLYGAMLAGCDYVMTKIHANLWPKDAAERTCPRSTAPCVAAVRLTRCCSFPWLPSLPSRAFPCEIPGILDDLSENNDVDYNIHTDGCEPDDERTVFNFSPEKFWEAAGKPEMAEQTLKRPKFLPIVSSVLLAQSMLKRARGKGPTKGIDGFVIELPTAGGHNAPPRGFRYDPVAKSHNVALNEKGEPVYGPKDEVDLAKFAKATKGLPFWLAGSYADPSKFADVIKVGGYGVQAGTLFAMSEESGMADHTKQRVLSEVSEGDLSVYTDPVASPTGFPFKVLELKGTLSEKDKYDARPRVCNLGYLRTPYAKDDGKIGYRCAAEPVRGLGAQGRGDRGHRRPQVPVQRPDG